MIMTHFRTIETHNIIRATHFFCFLKNEAMLVCFVFFFFFRCFWITLCEMKSVHSTESSDACGWLSDVRRAGVWIRSNVPCIAPLKSRAYMMMIELFEWNLSSEITTLIFRMHAESSEVLIVARRRRFFDSFLVGNQLTLFFPPRSGDFFNLKRSKMMFFLAAKRPKILGFFYQKTDYSPLVFVQSETRGE